MELIDSRSTETRSEVSFGIEGSWELVGEIQSWGFGRASE